MFWYGFMSGVSATFLVEILAIIFLYIIYTGRNKK